MNLAEQIFQSYIYTDVYNSMGGGNAAVAGIPIAKLLDVDGEQMGGARKPKFAEHLSVPAGLVLVNTPAAKSNETPSQCEVIPDELFNQMVLLASVHTSKRKQTKSLRPKKGARITKRGEKQ